MLWSESKSHDDRNSKCGFADDSERPRCWRYPQASSFQYSSLHQHTSTAAEQHQQRIAKFELPWDHLWALKHQAGSHLSSDSTQCRRLESRPFFQKTAGLRKTGQTWGYSEKFRFVAAWHLEHFPEVRVGMFREVDELQHEKSFSNEKQKLIGCQLSPGTDMFLPVVPFENLQHFAFHSETGFEPNSNQF